MVTISRKEYNKLKQSLQEALALIDVLRVEIQFLKNGRNSNTSSTPGSQDFSRPNRQNFRQKSGLKSGGQHGHKGSTLKMVEHPDEIQKHIPHYCKHCGEAFAPEVEMQLESRRQEVVIPPINPKYVEHQSYSCICAKCGKQTTAELPSYLRASIQYGKDIQALITYLSVYQYLPSNRIKSYLKDVMGMEMSEGTIYNILASMSQKAIPAYRSIEEKISFSAVVGGDETGIKINGKKGWLWVFQNKFLTYLKASYSRGYKTIADTFSEGFPVSVYISDSLPAQLKIKTRGKQLCMAHLMRELKNFEEVLKSQWATQLKKLFKRAVEYKKQMKPEDYSPTNQQIQKFEKRLNKLLRVDNSRQHKKQQAFQKRLIKNRDSIFTFLYYEGVSPDNNGSERAIRNAKVKMKISNQFKSIDFAEHYATIRSVIDTTIKNSGNVFYALSCLANQNLSAAE